MTPVTRQDVMDEVSKLRDSIDRWRVQVQTRQDKHDEVLFGNGKPGMDEQIRTISSYISVLVRFGWIVAGCAVSIAISGIVYVVIYLIKAMP